MTATTIVFNSPSPSIDLPSTTLHEHLRARARSFGDLPALIDGNSGQTVSYAELDRQIGSVAAGLAARGLRKRDVVAVMSPNCIEYPAAVLGTMAAGGVATLVNPTYAGDELAHQLRDSGATRVIVFVMFLQAVVDVADQCGIEEIFVLHGDEGHTPFQVLLDHDPTPVDVEVAPSDLAALPYSSGTTGRSKGVCLTHDHLVAQLHQIEAMLEITDEDRALGFLPMFHIMGFAVVVLASMNAGARVITLPMFEPTSFLSTIQNHRVNKLIVVPPVVNLLAYHPMVDEYDLTSVELVGCGAAPLGAETERALAARLGCETGQGWGMTETSGGATMPRLTSTGVESRAGSSGKLVPNCEAVIIDPETGASLGPNETGELWVRGPNIFSEYHANAEATAVTIDADGWLHTGDLCHLDEDGFLFVTDRLKELIKVKGFQVAPAELEALLLDHPDVADVAVIGRPDDRSGEVPIAFIVPNGELDAAALQAWVAARVTDYKQLADVIETDAIPKNPSGKILRRVLRDQLGA